MKGIYDPSISPVCIRMPSHVVGSSVCVYQCTILWDESISVFCSVTTQNKAGIGPTTWLQGSSGSIHKHTRFSVSIFPSQPSLGYCNTFILEASILLLGGISQLVQDRLGSDVLPTTPCKMYQQQQAYISCFPVPGTESGFHFQKLGTNLS